MSVEMKEVMVPAETVKIQDLIYVIRGKQVMIDSDLAVLYDVKTKRLNEAVKRNSSRFPERFCFQLSKEEFENLRSQFATSSLDDNTYGGRRTMPFAFTEQGIAMLSSVLRSDFAVNASIRIMDTFVEMRKYMSNAAFLNEKMNAMEMRQIAMEEKTEQRFEQVFDYIESHKQDNQKIFFEGQIFDAFSLMTDLIRQAEDHIVLIDGYVDVSTLNILAKKKPQADICIYTLPSARITSQDIQNFNAQYPVLEIKHTTVFHDRFLIIDHTQGYHIGASIKDAGNKCFGINRIEDMSVINELIRRAESTSS